MKNAPCAFPQPLRRDSRSHSCFKPADVADRTNRLKLSFIRRNCGSVVMRPLRTNCRMALALVGFSSPSSAS